MIPLIKIDQVTHIMLVWSCGQRLVALVYIFIRGVTITTILHGFHEKNKQFSGMVLVQIQ